MMLNCKQASRLMSEGMDRELDLGQRAALRFHLFLCTACTRMKTQFEFLHRAAPLYPGPDDDAGSK